MIQNKELFYIVEYLKKYDPIQYSLIKFVNDQNGSGEIFQQPDNTTIGYLTFLRNNIYSCFTYWTKLSMGEPLILTGNTFLFIDTKLSFEHINLIYYIQCVTIFRMNFNQLIHVVH